MRFRLTIVTLAIVAMVGFVAAEQSDAARTMMEAARKTEVVDGDLKGAIQQYKTIVDRYKTDRAVTATALVQMAECYQKLGDAESRKIYERVVRDYADQKEAVSVARAQLGRTESAERAGGMSSRQVWTLPPSGTIDRVTVSHDGRYLPYTDWAVPRGNGELFLHDIVAGANRRITNDVEKFGQEFVEEATFSPDDTQLAYALFNKDHYELRIIGVQAPPASHPRVLFSNSEVPRIFPGDWSADGKWLAVQLQRKDKTAQIGLVAVKDGSLRVLKSVDWRGSSNLFFSPDSRYLAYDLPTTDTGNRRDVFVLAIDGSREMPAVVHPSHDVLMGWSPDGRRLLFTSDRTGSTGLWALAFVDGKPQGTPEQIKVDVTGNSMGLTRKGTLYSLVHHSNFTGVVRSDIQVAAFDFAKGQFLSTPGLAVQTFVGANNFPAWSPDGKYLALLSRRGREDTVIVILSHATGQLRELQPQLTIYVGGAALRWSPDGLSLAIQATDSKGRQGIFRIDATTGEATPIALSSRGPVGGESFIGPAWAPDGKRIYYNRINRASEGAFTAIVERDLSSGNEKEVIRRSGRTPFWDLSPDGKYWVVADGDFVRGGPIPGRAGKWNVLLIPASGGEPKELMRGESQGGGVLMWAPDSHSIFVYSIKDEFTGDREVWRVAIDGTEPQKLGLNVNFLGPLYNSDQQFHAHPDGKRVAFAATEPAKPDEVWALENFLTTLSAKK
ncbi:MAG: PD40 domain-containing protein [Acidobacteria bacterium]|nr:PD40 domain-containing protein [Acidobacteriota bacterium]